MVRPKGAAAVRVPGVPGQFAILDPKEAYRSDDDLVEAYPGLFAKIDLGDDEDEQPREKRPYIRRNS